MTPPARRWTSPARLVLLGVILTVAAAAIAFGMREVTPAAVFEAARGLELHWWTAPLYLLLYALMNVLLIPTQPLSVVAVALWGWKMGATIELISASIGALPPYLIARRKAAPLAADSEMTRWEKFLRKDTFLSLLVLRIVPVVPYTPLNYLAGAAGVSSRDYVMATVIGLLPSTYLFAWLLDSILAGVVSPAAAMTRIFTAGVAFLAFIAALRFLSKHLRSRVT